jgi:hypothetical protein
MFLPKINSQVRISRNSAALYLAFECGIKGAVARLAAAIPDGPGFIVLPVLAAKNGRHTKTNAEGWVNRIRLIVSFQEGRLGKPLSCGLVYVR